MSNTYRPRRSEQWGYIPVIFTLLVIGYLAILFFPAPLSPRRAGTNLWILGATGSFLVLVVTASVRTSNSRIILDDIGIEWKGGGEEPGRLRWEEIKGLDYDRLSRSLKIGVVQKSDGRFRPLPFVTKDLYCALKERVGNLPTEVEGECMMK